MEKTLKKTKINETKKFFKKDMTINAMLMLTIGLSFISCAKNKELETVYKTPEIIEKNNFEIISPITKKK